MGLLLTSTFVWGWQRSPVTVATCTRWSQHPSPLGSTHQHLTALWLSPSFSRVEDSDWRGSLSLETASSTFRFFAGGWQFFLTVCRWLGELPVAAHEHCMYTKLYTCGAQWRDVMHLIRDIENNRSHLTCMITCCSFRVFQNLPSWNDKEKQVQTPL